MPRKTVPIESLRDWTNQFLELSFPEMRAQREGMYLILEKVLFETGNYRGFRYCTSQYNEKGTLLIDNFDDTRRVYY